MGLVLKTRQYLQTGESGVVGAINYVYSVESVASMCYLGPFASGMDPLDRVSPSPKTYSLSSRDTAPLIGLCGATLTGEALLLQGSLRAKDISHRSELNGENALG